MERLTNTRKKILGALLDAAPNGSLVAVELGARTGVKSGSLYPALRVLVDAGLLEGRWVVEDDEPAKVYRLTPNGVLLARAVEADEIVHTSWRAFLPEAMQ